MKLLRLSSLLLFALSIPGCRTTTPLGASQLRDDEQLDHPCRAVHATHGVMVNNFATAPVNDPAFFAPASDGQELERVVALYQTESCKEHVRQLLTTGNPNIYIYFTGYGGPQQFNQTVDEGHIMQWINRRDPTGLIFSVSWDCDQAERSGFNWCATEAKTQAFTPEKPAYKFMNESFNALLPEPEAIKFMTQTAQIAAQQQGGYNRALTNSIHNATALINSLLHLSIGKVHVAGYSMGAHAAADILIADFTEAGETTGYPWSKASVCANGQEVCTVAELSAMNWSLAMGLSGWSDALQHYNQFSDEGIPARPVDDRDLYENGGLLRISADRYHNKLNVFNRRMDPTSNANDNAQRAINDVIFADYNHYSHDYSQPPFRQAPFIKTLEAFLAAENPADLKEIGVIHDAAAFSDFDHCAAEGACTSISHYLAHRVNRSHGDLKIMESPHTFATVEGVPHGDRQNNRAVQFVDGTQPLILQTMDQEDLRGGVEFYFRPDFDPKAPGTHGLFSYGACTRSEADLMPEAAFHDGRLLFRMSYQGTMYTVEAPADDPRFKQGQWMHLAFTWDLPTFAISRNPLELSEDGTTLNKDLPAESRKANLAGDVQKYGQAIVVAATLRSASASTFKMQKGRGTMRIFVNGELAKEGVLGTEESSRDCLPAADVLAQTAPYYVGKDQAGTALTYPAYIPYANYDATSGDVVSLGMGMNVGTKCKAFKIRNVPVHFGCAGSEAVTAKGDMDDVALIFGHGREAYHNVGRNGIPKPWPVSR